MNKTLKKYFTEYQYNGKRYGEEIYAENREQAEAILKSKRKTEKITGYDPTVEYLLY